MTLDDLEHQNRSFIIFWQFWALRHISRAKSLEIDQDKLRMKFFALNGDFNGSSFDFSRFKKTCARGHQRAVPFKSRYFTTVG